MVRALLPHFRARRSGRIVNIGSGAGFTAEPFAGWYTVSKFAIEGFSETLWHELRPFGVRVSLVQPGWCRTNIVRDALRAAQPIAEYDPWRTVSFEAATGISRPACRPTPSRDVFSASSTRRARGCGIESERT